MVVLTMCCAKFADAWLERKPPRVLLRAHANVRPLHSTSLAECMRPPFYCTRLMPLWGLALMCSFNVNTTWREIQKSWILFFRQTSLFYKGISKNKLSISQLIFSGVLEEFSVQLIELLKLQVKVLAANSALLRYTWWEFHSTTGIFPVCTLFFHLYCI